MYVKNIDIKNIVVVFIGQIGPMESLFVYPPGTNATTYARDDGWTPGFPDEITVPDNITQFCNNDPQCIFDYDQTGDPEIGMGTMMTNQGNLEDQAQSCEFLYFSAAKSSACPSVQWHS